MVSPWPRLADLKPGDVLRADEGFTCLHEGEDVIVQQDTWGELFVMCAGVYNSFSNKAPKYRPTRNEKHYLEGQLGHEEGYDDDRVVGLRRVVEGANVRGEMG